jgi:hypothetical protein
MGCNQSKLHKKPIISGNHYRLSLSVSQTLEIRDIFDNHVDSDVPNINKLRRHFYAEGRVSFELAAKLISMAEALLKAEPNLLYLRSPINLLGDIHGKIIFANLSLR